MPLIPESTNLNRLKIILNELSDQPADLFYRILYCEYAARTRELKLEVDEVTPGERSEAVAALCGELEVEYTAGETEKDLNTIVIANLGRTLAVLWNWILSAASLEDEKWDAKTVDGMIKFLSPRPRAVQALFLSAFPPEEVAAVLAKHSDSERVTIFRELGKVEAFYASDAELLKQVYDLLLSAHPDMGASRTIQDVFDGLERLDRRLIGKLSELSAIFAQVVALSPGRIKRVIEVLTTHEIGTLLLGCSRSLRHVILPALPAERLPVIREEICERGPCDISIAASARLLIVEALRRLSKKTQFWGFVRGERIIGCPKCGRTFAVPVSRRRVIAKCPHCEETRIIKPIRKTEQLLIPRTDSTDIPTPVIQNVTGDELDGYIHDIKIDLELIERQKQLDSPGQDAESDEREVFGDLFETFTTNMKDLFFIHLSKKLNLAVREIRQGLFDSFVTGSHGSGNVYLLADFLQGVNFVLEIDRVVVNELLAVLRERIKDGLLVESPPERRVFHYFIDIFNRALKTVEPRNLRFDFRNAAYYDSISKVNEFRPDDEVTCVTFDVSVTRESGIIRAIFPTQLLRGFSFPPQK
ncbi:MAG: FliG C-terminal domain-containing protein [Planctomycetota bacterium]